MKHRSGFAVLGVVALLLSLPAGPARAGSDVDPLVELGRRLFFEPMASPSGLRSCASCHDPAHGFSDPKRVSVDDFGTTKRHSQAILDMADNPSAHWDGEFTSVADLVERRLSMTRASAAASGYGERATRVPSHDETRPMKHEESVENLREVVELVAMVTPRRGTEGVAPPDKRRQRELIHKHRHVLMEVIARKRSTSARRPGRNRARAKEVVPQRINQSRRYAEAAHAAFGRRTLGLDDIASSIDAYCKSIRSTESPFDRYRAGEDRALNAAARRGLELFEGTAGCAQCHATDGPRAPLTDYAFHNTGVAWKEAHAVSPMDGGLALAELLEDERFTKTLGAFGDVRNEQLDRLISLLGDDGRHRRARKAENHRAFKTPTLRDVAKRGPYMHDGRLTSLEDVVRHYAAGCGDDPRKDGRLKPFEVSDRDVADLVAFLESLTGDERPGLAKTAWERRTLRTNVQIVDTTGAGIGGLPVTVSAGGDVVPTRSKGLPAAVTLVTSKGGWIDYPVPPSTHAHVAVVESVLPAISHLVPDTCHDTRIELPVSGRMKVTVVLPQGRATPDAVYVGPDPRRPLDSRAVEAPPPTRFARVGSTVEDGQPAVTYEGWVRTDYGTRNIVVMLEDPRVRPPAADARLPRIRYSAGTETHVRSR